MKINAKDIHKAHIDLMNIPEGQLANHINQFILRTHVQFIILTRRMIESPITLYVYLFSAPPTYSLKFIHKIRRIHFQE